MLILLVEDSEDDARIVKEFLWLEPAAADYELIHATTYAKALEQLDSFDFDLILLDLSLPDAEGLELVSNINAKAPKAGIVVLTGYADSDNAVEALHKGAEEYLVKMDLTSAALLRCIRYAFERHSSRREIKQLRGRLIWAERGETIARKAGEIAAAMQQPLATARDLVDSLAETGDESSHAQRLSSLREKLTEVQDLAERLPQTANTEDETP
jgi:DNA-binding response OmpR family regulator